MAVGNAPAMEILVDINAASLARTELDPRSLMRVRLAALATGSDDILHASSDICARL